nr:ATP synthase F0 subunit 8 [Paradorydium reflexanum]
MSPMWWMWTFMHTILCMIVMIMMLYFMFNHKNKCMNKITKKSSINWKW